MTTKQMVRITLIACILTVVFYMFSNIIYLEMITCTLLVFTLVFDKREMIFASLLFTFLNMLFIGITPWSISYMFIYPLYTWMISVMKNKLLKYTYLIPVICGILSFLTGQLMDLSFILFSPKVTFIYILLGLKTSIIQGVLSGIICMFIYKPLMNQLEKIRKE